MAVQVEDFTRRRTYDPSLVSIVVRTMGDREPELRRALQSLVASDYGPIEAVVVVQADVMRDAQWHRVQAICGEFPGLASRLVRNAASDDRRAQNLNLGWRAARGRYIGFLDDDDELLPSHVSQLAGAIQQGHRVWAYGRTLLCREDEQLRLLSTSEPFRRGDFSLAALWEENFIPIHSFLIDRQSLHEELRDQPFCEQLTRSEDWDFLLRLAFHHEPVRVDALTCRYFISSTQRNSNASLASHHAGQEHERNQARWQASKQLVDERKAALAARHWWARSLFGGGVEAVASPAQVAAAPTALRRRAIRYLIRRLERLL